MEDKIIYFIIVITMLILFITSVFGLPLLIYNKLSKTKDVPFYKLIVMVIVNLYIILFVIYYSIILCKKYSIFNL